MKTRIVLFVLTVALAGSLAAQNAASLTPKQELAVILQRLNKKSAEDGYMNNPGWLDANVQNDLQLFAKLNAGTEDALTAEIWLTVSQTESFQHEQLASRKSKAAVQSVTLAKIIQRSTNTWHRKVARLARAGTLLTATDYAGLQSQVG